MNTNFINRKDRIIASAIEIISEAGLESLTTKNLAMKENMSESLLYRYFGGIDEVLVEVIDAYVKFDNRIIATIEAKDISHIERVLEFLDILGTYYEGYYEMAAIVLNYEGFLHNVNTRDKMAMCIDKRMEFVCRELRLAMQEGEIKSIFTEEELYDLLFGSVTRDLLNRRIRNDSQSHSKTASGMIEKLVGLIRTE